MKNITYKSIRSLLILLLVSTVTILTLFILVNVAQKGLANWMYKNYTEPFLILSLQNNHPLVSSR